MIGYVLSGLVAAALAITFRIVSEAIIEAKQQDSIITTVLGIVQHWKWQWTTMTLVTTVTTAYLADNRANEWVAVQWQPWIEGLVQGLVTALAMGLTLWLLTDSGADTSHLLWRLPVSFVLGFILGYILPTWYRRALREQACKDDTFPFNH